MHPNFKQVGGLILAVIGFILIIYSIHALHEFSEANGFSNNVKNFFTHNPWWNPIIKFFGGTPQLKVSQYNASVLATLIAGIVCVVIGFAGIDVFRKKKRK